MSDESDGDDVIILPDFHVEGKPNAQQEDISIVLSNTSDPVIRRNSNESSDSLEYVDAEEGASPNIVTESGSLPVPGSPQATVDELVTTTTTTTHLALVTVPREEENEMTPPLQKAFNDTAESVLETLMSGEETNQQLDCIFADDVTPLKDYKRAINYQPSDAPTYFAKVFYVASLENRSRDNVTKSLEFLKTNDNGQTNMIDRMFYLLKAKNLISNGSNNVFAELIDHKTSIDNERKSEWERREAIRQLVVESNAAEIEKQKNEIEVAQQEIDTMQNELESTQLLIEKAHSVEITKVRSLIIDDEELLKRKRKFDKVLETEARLIESPIVAKDFEGSKQEDQKMREDEESKLREDQNLKIIEEIKLKKRQLKLKKDEEKEVQAEQELKIRVLKNRQLKLKRDKQMKSQVSTSLIPQEENIGSGGSNEIRNNHIDPTFLEIESTNDAMVPSGGTELPQSLANLTNMFRKRVLERRIQMSEETFIHLVDSIYKIHSNLASEFKVDEVLNQFEKSRLQINIEGMKQKMEIDSNRQNEILRKLQDVQSLLKSFENLRNDSNKKSASNHGQGNDLLPFYEEMDVIANRHAQLSNTLSLLETDARNLQYSLITASMFLTEHQTYLSKLEKGEFEVDFQNESSRRVKDAMYLYIEDQKRAKHAQKVLRTVLELLLELDNPQQVLQVNLKKSLSILALALSQVQLPHRPLPKEAQSSVALPLSQLQQMVPSSRSVSTLQLLPPPPPPPPPPSSESHIIPNSIKTVNLPPNQSTDPRILRKLEQQRKRQEEQLRKEQSAKIVELLRRKLPSSIVTNDTKSVEKASSEKVVLNKLPLNKVEVGVTTNVDLNPQIKSPQRALVTPNTAEVAVTSKNDSKSPDKALQPAPVISNNNTVQSEQSPLKPTVPISSNFDMETLDSPPQHLSFVDLPDVNNMSPVEKIGRNDLFEEHSDGEHSVEILDKPQVICTVCSEIFTDYKSLTKHFIGNH